MKLISRSVIAGAMMGFALITSAQAAEVAGFRSAHFGANEKTVADAMVKDLNIKASDIEKTQEPTARVTVLSAKIKNFAPLGMPAKVSYVLGFKCNCLTQVSVSWDLPEGTTQEQRKGAMVGISALVGRFDNMGWEKDEVVKNRVPGEIKDGSENLIVFFHAQNKANASITMAGGPVKMEHKGAAKAGEMAANVDDLKNVTVAYEKDAMNPDVFKVDVSGF